jgi:pimeloyl-ACP methyl ester carboxylesterase
MVYLRRTLASCWQRAEYLASQLKKHYGGILTPLSSAQTTAHQPLLDPQDAKLDDSATITMTLSDSRRLSYARYGAPSGPVIFCLHGLPGSRTQGAYFHAAATNLGARIIRVDCPGVGFSSPQPGRTVLEHADDIVHPTKHLDIDQFSVLGCSGGRPYALACAKTIPRERLRGVALVAGVGPSDIGFSGMNAAHRLLFLAFKYMPSAVRWLRQKTLTALSKLSDDKT